MKKWIVLPALLLAVSIPVYPEGDGAARGSSASGLPPALAKLLPGIQRAVSELRELPWKSEVSVAVESRDGLRDRLLATLDEEIPVEEFTNRELVLRKIGLYRDDIPLRELLVETYTSEIAGFYDKDEKALYVLDDIPVGTREILAHELIHALQDQHFDLTTLPLDDYTNSDGGFACLALIEGDATLGMIEYLSREGGEACPDLGLIAETLDLAVRLSPNLKGLPEWLAEEMIFPYVRGTSFVSVLRRKEGQAGVRRAFGDLPASTEQILHPEKYLSRKRDYPRAITIPDLEGALGPGWHRIFNDCVGEFGIDLWLTQFLPDLAPSASSGWDGDRLTAYRFGETDRVVIALVSVWDSALHAAEFQLAMRELTEQEKPSMAMVPFGAAPGALLFVSADDTVFLERREDQVIFVETAPLEGIASVREALWRSEVREVRAVPRQEAPHRKRERPVGCR
ncbi:MAG: hypothetical protein V2A58_12075 [Planctomycetota bacterium]